MKKLVLWIFMIPLFTFAQEQERKYGLGLIEDDEAYSQIPMKPRNVGFQDVIADLTQFSLKKYVPEIQNQGGYGTCVGWACAYYAKTIMEAVRDENTDTYDITKNAYAPLFTYFHAKKVEDSNCKNGAVIDRALQHLVDQGSPYKRDFDAYCALSIPDSIYNKAARHKIKDFVRLFSYGDDPVDRVDYTKRALANKKPVVIGMILKNSFDIAKTVYEPDTLATIGGHAMTVIGYDDGRYGGAFEIANSWGSDWGNDGFMWIRYADFAEYTRYAYEMILGPKQEEEEVVKNSLAGSMEITLTDNSKMPIERAYQKPKSLGFQDVVADSSKVEVSVGDYVTKKEYRLNTRYRIKTEINKPAYVYILGADVKHPAENLFPMNDSISPYVDSSAGEIILPSKDHVFRLNTDDIPSDYTIAIFSLEQLDLNAVKTKMDSTEGKIIDKLYTIFQDRLIDKEDITLSEEKMGFNAEFEKGSMAMLILDIKREFQESSGNGKQ